MTDTFYSAVRDLGKKEMKRHLFSLEEDIFVADNSAVLLVEADNVTREITTGMLQYLGYSVEAVRKGREAVVLYKLRKDEGNPFKAVILDVCHPKARRGIETLRELIEYDPDVKVVASSGFTGDFTLDGPEGSDFQASLPKPYGIRQLGSVLRAVVNSGPKKEKLTNIRRDVRHGISGHFRFVVGDKSGNVCKGVAIDVSKHGLGFLTETVLTEGQAIKVTDHDLLNIAGCEAQVVWVKKEPRRYRAGAKFVLPC